MSEITAQLVRTNSFLNDMATLLVIMDTLLVTIAILLYFISFLKDSNRDNTKIEKRLDELIEEIRKRS